MDWPHTEETTKRYHQTGPQMEPNSSTSSKLVSFILIGCLRLALIFITLVLLWFNLSPSLIDVSARRDVVSHT
jgi:hypothetical protein